MPYTPHRYFKTPADKAKLWRYMDLARLISMLSNRSLFFSRADELDDSWEGALSPVDVRRGWRRLRKWGQHERDGGQSYCKRWNDRFAACQNELRRRVYVSCWHRNPGESLAMWKLYADKGIAVQTTVARLKDALGESAGRMIYIGKVEYPDYAKTGVSGDHELSPFMNKRKSFACEREVRALFMEPTTESGDEELLGEPAFQYRSVSAP